MNIELTGILGTIASFCFVFTGCCIIVIGTIYVLQYFIWEILVAKTLLYFKAYNYFRQWIFHRKKFKEWLDEKISEQEKQTN